MRETRRRIREMDSSGITVAGSISICYSRNDVNNFFFFLLLCNMKALDRAIHLRYLHLQGWEGEVECDERARGSCR